MYLNIYSVSSVLLVCFAAKDHHYPSLQLKKINQNKAKTEESKPYSSWRSIAICQRCLLHIELTKFWQILSASHHRPLYSSSFSTASVFCRSGIEINTSCYIKKQTHKHRVKCDTAGGISSPRVMHFFSETFQWLRSQSFSFHSIKLGMWKRRACDFIAFFKTWCYA